MASSSIAIPQRKQPLVVTPAEHSSSVSSDSSSSPSSYDGTPTPVLRSRKGKERVRPGDESPGSVVREKRRLSLLGDSLAQSEYTVVDLSHSEAAAPRLVTCVKSSQGFNWNQELFLPSYADHDSRDLEHRPDPVEDIILTDEEAQSILPQ